MCIYIYYLISYAVPGPIELSIASPIADEFDPGLAPSGLENSTRPLVFTSASGCRAGENFDISSANEFFPHICQYFL